MSAHEEAHLGKQFINKAAVLRKRIQAGGSPLALPGAFNAITAKIAEKVGFEAVYISGASIANGVGGYPDIGLMSATEMAQQAGFIARATHLPAIADGDNGYGEASNVFRTVQLYEREGLSGIHIEDQVMPKRCGHLNGKQVISPEAMAEKIAAAKEARSNPDFMIIARVDSKNVYGLSDAIDRANLCAQAGADAIFSEALESDDEFLTFRKEVSIPLMGNMTEFGKTPLFSLQDFEGFGYNMVIFPMTAFRIMMAAVEGAYQTLKAEGSQRNLLSRMTNREDLYRLLHYQAYEALDAGLATQYSKRP